MGHYGRNLIAPVYVLLPQVRVKAIVSQHATSETLEKTLLVGVPIVRSFKEWLRIFGEPTSEDIFDLCVHHQELPDLLKGLSEIGGKCCILPKPVAVTQKNWNAISRINKKYEMRCAVASQWYYSRLTKTLAISYKKLTQKTQANNIAMEFSQAFTDAQLTHYSPTSGFLPHMLQILSSIGIPLAALGERRITYKNLRYEISYAKPTPIHLVTNMGSKTLGAPQKVRRVRIFTAENLPVIDADFYAQCNNGQAIEENILLTMTKKILAGLAEEILPFAENHGVLSLENYWPIARELIALNSLMTTPSVREIVSGTDR